jgi:acetyl-CoA carboxylase carboxyl transferase subunit alpha
VLFFVDTPGAFPGIEAEEHGIAEAVARNLYEFSSVKTPMITVITGEGGSGGALALSVSDRIFMMENAIFSVISPEGCASILFKDAGKAPLAAQSLKLTAKELKKLAIIDDVISEGDGLHVDSSIGFANLETALYAALQLLMKCDLNELIEKRYEKYRKIGFWEEKSSLKKKVMKKGNFFTRLFRRNK